nr:hypothetical protein [Tanacetum cinerariifolium]
LLWNDIVLRIYYTYYAKESPIPPPTIVPPSPKFNSQEFFLSKELLSPKKHGRDQSSSSTPTLPHEFELGESSRKSSLERHEEKIKEILNHLNEMPPKRTSTFKAPAMTLAAIRQLVADSVTAALEAQAANMVQKELLDLSAGLSVLNQCFPVATVPKTA